MPFTASLPGIATVGLANGKSATYLRRTFKTGFFGNYYGNTAVSIIF